MEEGREDGLILCPGFDKAQEVLLAGERDAHGNHHRQIGKGLAVEKHRHHVSWAQVAVLKSLERLGTGPPEGPGHRRTR